MNKRGVLAWIAVGLIPAAFLVVFFLWPTATLVARGFHDGQSWTLDGFEQMATSARTLRALWFTLVSATIATLLCVVLGVPGAYVLYRLRFPAQSIVRGVVTVPFVLPTVVVGIAFSWLQPVVGIIAAMVFFNYCVVVRTVGALWGRLDPRQVEAAQALGASPLKAMWDVTLPGLRPAIISAAALAFLFSASGFGIVMTLGRGAYQTIETEIWFQTTQILNLSAAAALSITQLVVVSMMLWLSNHFQRRSEVALKLLPESTAGRPPRSSDVPAIALTAVVIVGLIVVPMVGLVVRSFRYGGQWSVIGYERLFDARLGGAIVTTLVTASAAAALALLLGILVALVSSRRPQTRAGKGWLSVVESAFMLPLGVSAVTVGFGYLITLNKPPLDLRSSVVLIPIAQALVALPLVVRTLLPTLRAISVRQIQAASTLGASPWRALATIEFPAVGRGLGLALGFALATSLGEFGATSFLARPDNPTLPVLIYKLFSRPTGDNYITALAASVVLAVMTAAVMIAAEQVRPREVTT